MTWLAQAAVLCLYLETCRLSYTVCMHTERCAGTQSLYLYVCGRVHPGVPFVSGSSWFLSALSQTHSVVHSADWEPCVRIAQLIMNWKQRLRVLFPSSCSKSQWTQLISWGDNVSTAAWGLRRYHNNNKLHMRTNKVASKWIVAEAGRERWTKVTKREINA